ncbi:hypothetical protein MNBD_NITROSPINAE04-1572 [hydrothermal vent metagenome]|uniref:Uncharacterized protein n=1 Tax=hydrothermal vent metagenome TaxID=652676 RepID=A0A3B1C930_9ZZZZ
MNGARADPSVNTMSAPRRSRINIIGASQNFFLTLRKSQNSAAIDGLCIFSNSYFIIGKIFYWNNECLCKYLLSSANWHGALYQPEAIYSEKILGGSLRSAKPLMGTVKLYPSFSLK